MIHCWELNGDVGEGSFVNDMKMILKSRILKRLIGFEAHHDGFKLSNSLEWSVVAFVGGEKDCERLEAPHDYFFK